MQTTWWASVRDALAAFGATVLDLVSPYWELALGLLLWLRVLAIVGGLQSSWPCNADL